MSERAPLMMQRRGSMLVPVGPMDSETVMNLPLGKSFKVEVRQPRSIPHHRLYWSMLSLVCENLDQPIDTETLHAWVKLRTGHTKEIRLKSGEIVTVPGSIAFDKMDQPTFRAFFDKAADLICTHVIPGLGKEALSRQAQEMLGAS